MIGLLQGNELESESHKICKFSKTGQVCDGLKFKNNLLNRIDPPCVLINREEPLIAWSLFLEWNLPILIFMFSFFKNPPVILLGFQNTSISSPEDFLIQFEGFQQEFRDQLM